MKCQQQYVYIGFVVRKLVLLPWKGTWRCLVTLITGPYPSPLTNKRGKGSPLKELVLLLATGKQPSEDR